jgi:hypothetical protein
VITLPICRDKAMRQVKFRSFAGGVLIFLLLLAAGCGQTATIALKFAPEDITTYKLTTKAEQSVIWEGPVANKPKGFIGGHTGSKIELTFKQRILSVDDEGNAVAEITIDGLKYTAKVRDNVTLDFDSSRAKDQNAPLGRLIGQSYTIGITTSGDVSQVLDVNDARAAVGNVPRAVRLLSDEVIRGRHTVPALPGEDRAQLRTGDSWSNIKTFSFGRMGAKTYERIYKVKEIKNIDGHQTAVVGMSVVPSSKRAKELHKEQGSDFFSKMFDNPVEIYTGRLTLDLMTGKVEQYLEEFRSEWVAVDPAATDKDKEPDMLRMGAIRIYRIERVD